MSEMKKWCDRFRFTEKNESLYSLISVIGYLCSEGDFNVYSSGSSRLLIQRQKEFPKKALEVSLNMGINGESDLSKEGYVTAKKEELAGKINFENSTALIPLIKNYTGTAKTPTYTLKFSNLESERDHAQRLYYSFTGEGRSAQKNRVNSIVKDLHNYEWESFIQKLNSYLSRIPYAALFVNQRENIKALLQIDMYNMLETSTYPGRSDALMEEPTNKGRSDITMSIDDIMYIFEPKMFNDPENPSYEIKEKYLQKYLTSRWEHVMCIGFKFTSKGAIDSWGEGYIFYKWRTD